MPYFKGLRLEGKRALVFGGTSGLGKALAPGVFETDLNRNILNQPARKAAIFSRTPMKRFGQVEEIQGAAIFLASHSASFVTGASILVEGGFLAQGIGQ